MPTRTGGTTTKRFLRGKLVTRHLVSGTTFDVKSTLSSGGGMPKFFPNGNKVQVIDKLKGILIPYIILFYF